MDRYDFKSFDGQPLSYLAAGDPNGTPVYLVHGFVSDAQTNWVKGGTVALLAEKGFYVIAPDLRGHGESSKPHDEAAYPDDVLASDQLALLEHLTLGSFHLAGYSLGAITAARMIERGATPQSILLCGMGHGLTEAGGRSEQFVDALTGKTPKTDPFAAMVVGFVKKTGGDAIALAHVMRGRKSVSAEALARWRLPCLVLNGDKDNDNGSGQALADLIPGATAQLVPGTHMDAIFKPQFADAIAAWLESNRAGSKQ
ncbi:MAG: alpha/beta fold hydrolase [Pseudomonadota bacterium]